MLANSQPSIVKRTFEDGADEWERQYRGDITELGQLDLVRRADIVVRFLRDIEPAPDGGEVLRLLDVGCGTGHVLRELGEQEFDILGMDFVERMVAKAAKARRSGKFLAGDAMQIPIGRAQFHAVSIVGVLEYIPAGAEVLSEIKRVLKPQGWLVISFPNAASLFRRLHRIERAITYPARRLMERLGTGGSTCEEQRYCHYKWSERQARELLAAHGFVVDRVAYCTYGLKTPILERNSVNLAVSRWANARFTRSTFVSRCLAWTIVMRARAV